MKAYQIFLFLFLFGLVSASVDEMGIMGNQQIDFAEFNEGIGITEIHEISEIDSESSSALYISKILVSGVFILGNALVNMVWIVPLFQKYGVPLEVTAMFQTILTFLIFIALFYIVTGRSLKHGE